MTNGLWQPVAKNCFWANLYFLLLAIFFEAPAKTYMYLWPWTLRGADSCAAAVSGINYSIEIKLSSLLESVFHWQFETKMTALMMHCRAYPPPNGFILSRVVVHSSACDEKQGMMSFITSCFFCCCCFFLSLTGYHPNETQMWHPPVWWEPSFDCVKDHVFVLYALEGSSEAWSLLSRGFRITLESNLLKITGIGHVILSRVELLTQKNESHRSLRWKSSEIFCQWNDRIPGDGLIRRFDLLAGVRNLPWRWKVNPCV